MNLLEGYRKNKVLNKQGIPTFKKRIEIIRAQKNQKI